MLINDRGFLSREVINKLKSDRGVDTYVPLKKGMDAYDDAVRLARSGALGWSRHPNKKRTTQEIAFLEGIGPMWRSDEPEKDVPLNACVVHETTKDEYFVFVTTDTGKTARQIILTYELRPEIEEDYRQLKDFWKLDGFKSTKLDLIAFHIICVLLAYLFYQLYLLTDAGEKYEGKSLPVILKYWHFQHVMEKAESLLLIIYTDKEFAILPLIELMHIYAESSTAVKTDLDKFL
jgi:hypothetical protein